jgi:hypothetical protein
MKRTKLHDFHWPPARDATAFVAARERNAVKLMQDVIAEAIQKCSDLMSFHVVARFLERHEVGTELLDATPKELLPFLVRLGEVPDVHRQYAQRAFP